MSKTLKLLGITLRVAICLGLATSCKAGSNGAKSSNDSVVAPKPSEAAVVEHRPFMRVVMNIGAWQQAQTLLGLSYEDPWQGLVEFAGRVGLSLPKDNPGLATEGEAEFAVSPTTTFDVFLSNAIQSQAKGTPVLMVASARLPASNPEALHGALMSAFQSSWGDEVGAGYYRVLKFGLLRSRKLEGAVELQFVDATDYSKDMAAWPDSPIGPAFKGSDDLMRFGVSARGLSELAANNAAKRGFLSASTIEDPGSRSWVRLETVRDAAKVYLATDHTSSTIQQLNIRLTSNGESSLALKLGPGVKETLVSAGASSTGTFALTDLKAASLLSLPISEFFASAEKPEEISKAMNACGVICWTFLTFLANDLASFRAMKMPEKEREELASMKLKMLAGFQGELKEEWLILSKSDGGRKDPLVHAPANEDWSCYRSNLLRLVKEVDLDQEAHLRMQALEKLVADSGGDSACKSDSQSFRSRNRGVASILSSVLKDVSNADPPR